MSMLLGVVAGLVLGLTGAGGSIFAVPLLVLGLGWSLADAVPVALLAVCAAAAFGTAVAWNVAYVRYRAAILMALAGACTAPLGLWAAPRLLAPFLSLLFAAVLVLVALRMLLQARRAPAEARIVRATVAGDGAEAGGPLCGLHAQTGRLMWTLPCAALIGGIGAVTGLLSGLLGVGGGFVIVPALRAATPLSMHSAIATSLLAIALTSAAAVMGALALGHALPWAAALPFVGGALLGMLGGRLLAPRIAGPALQGGFAVAMLAVGVVMIRRAVA
ncbi:sulfite exporter TauE/SafE family protein [Solimonas sp. SE-A11]|uniref:sulfite exporter TauE/SafE family protein n=1 Tax=Solimonas sp. SE-A11 TaxID=3054954 RepID=UPI00259C728D|nr:sulfite exporter TauE/SafE family protein [Solimonas sp. SE-A11]MDM4772733.1 sulfite exporter TauE/SafE family protein [Solimonas sp. SE-A11]